MASVFAACWYVNDWSIWVPYLVALMVAIGARNVISFLRHKTFGQMTERRFPPPWTVVPLPGRMLPLWGQKQTSLNSLANSAFGAIAGVLCCG